MASLPARQPSQRRQSRSEQQPQAPASLSNEASARSRSEDSQTIFVNRPEDEEQEQQEQSPVQQPSNTANQSANVDDDDLQRCWICMSDSTEDTPETSRWRDPCPCALVAHEECLLDWIADMEAPKNSRSTGVSAPEIKCPQCKADIKLARPRDYLVDAVRGIERIGARMVLPASGLSLMTVLTNISMSAGVHSIYAVFGAVDGFRILNPVSLNAIRPPVEVYAGTPGEASRQLWRLLLDHAVHWRLYLGVPLITPILILSRTTLADQILPVLPVVFFASQAPYPDDALDLLQWPPSASLAFSVLPYIRALYNACYDKVWSEREEQWIKEIQPRAQNEGENEGAEQGEQDRPADQVDDGNVFEVRIDGGIWDEWDDEDEEEDEVGRLVQEAADNQPPAAAPVPAPATAQPQAEAAQDDANVDANANANLQGEADAAPAPVVQDMRGRAPPQQAAAAQQNAAQDQNQNQNQNAQANVQRRVTFSPTGIAETVLGALLFPTIAGLSGELLKLVLPASWVSSPPTYNLKSRFSMARPSGLTMAQPNGFFQSKWARSLVGGCLFVVLKDALVLYTRWKMAQMHRKRRVVDHDRTK